MRLHRLYVSLLVVLLSGCYVDLGGISDWTRVDPFTETVVLGERGPKLVLVPVEGLITEMQQSSPLGLSTPSMVAQLRETLELASDDDEVAGLLLRVQSPGGSVAASETFHHELEQWKEETGKPVVAYLQGLATSGGYYVCVVADKLIAHPTTITGSIGVMMRGVNLSGLMEKLGIQDQTFTSGAFKDTGSLLRPMRDEEREQIQTVIADLHARFREVVAKGRPDLDPETIQRLSDGRVLTARQAMDEGLIDEIGYLEDAVESAEKLAGIEESRVVSYHRPSDYRNNIYSRAPSVPVQVVDIDVLTPLGDYLRPGFYYLWPGILEVRR